MAESPYNAAPFGYAQGAVIERSRDATWCVHFPI